MEWLISLCVRRRHIAVILSALALALEVWGAWNTPLDVFPDFAPAQITVYTEAAGFTAEQIEELITHPIEKTLNGASGVATVRSESIPGLSVITVAFESNANLYNARQDVTDRLATVRPQLPSEAGTPQLSPLTPGTRDILKVGMTSNKIAPYALRDIAEYVIKPRLLALPGVAVVKIFGGAVREIHIQPDPNLLTAYNFSIPDLIKAAPAALALRGAGFIDLQGQRVLIQTPTPSPDVRIIGDGILGVRNGTPIRLRDVATIEQQPAQRTGDALIQGQPGVLFSVSSQSGANTLSTTRAVEHALRELAPSLKVQGITLYPTLHQPATFIERALSGLEGCMLIGALLIFFTLYAFLRDMRSAIISFISIPLSVLAAIAVLDYFGYTLNTMTLSGLIVALGVLVDDAVVSVENILRRLRDNAQLRDPLPRVDVIRNASFEVHGPVFYATLVVLAVFVPELLSSSVQGRFVGPLALAFMLSVAASLVVALTTTPALSALLLYPEDAHVDAGWISLLKRFQARLIEFFYDHTYIPIAVVTVAFGASLWLLSTLGGTFLPEFREGHLVVQVTSALPGTSINEMLALGRRMSADMLALPYVATVEQQVGRAEGSDDTFGPHQSEFQVELRPDVDVDQAQAEAQIRQIVGRYPGIQSEVVTFLGDRISEALTGQTAQVAIKLFGEDLDTLDTTATKAVAVLTSEPGIVDLQFTRQSRMPVLDVTPDPAALAATGLKAQDVLDTVASDYAGTPVGEAYAGTATVNVLIQLSQAWRNQPNQLRDLTIGGAFGPVPLSSVAKITPAEGRYSIRHENGLRFVPITFNVSGRSLQGAVSEASDRIANAGIIPPGVRVDFSGAAAAEQHTRIELIFYSAVALAFVFVILLAGLRWRGDVWLVMANLPFSIIGGIVAIYYAGIGLSLGALVGLVTVFGISARNAILLLSYYEQLVVEEGKPWDGVTLVLGANERLAPVLMTAILTAMGLAPLAIAINQPGQEISGPMAIAVLGGLASSTILNLFFLPALAARFGRTGSTD
jgi:CzcA family heavy metal efflux pump